MRLLIELPDEVDLLVTGLLQVLVLGREQPHLEVGKLLLQRVYGLLEEELIGLVLLFGPLLLSDELVEVVCVFLHLLHLFVEELLLLTDGAAKEKN